MPHRQAPEPNEKSIRVIRTYVASTVGGKELWAYTERTATSGLNRTDQRRKHKRPPVN